MIPTAVQTRAAQHLRTVLGPAVGQDLTTHWARRVDDGWLFGVATRGFAEAGEGAVLAPLLVPDDGREPYQPERG